MTSGSRANQNGSGLEDVIEDALQRQGYSLVEAAILIKNYQSLGSLGSYYARQVVVGDSPYEGKKRRVDVFSVSPVFQDGLIFEYKWQQGSGSKEESFPYLVKSIQKTRIPTIVILDGKGYTPGAEKHLKEEVDGRFLIAVWDISEFLKAINTGYFDSGIMPSSEKTYEKVNPFQPKTLWDEEKKKA